MDSQWFYLRNDDDLFLDPLLAKLLQPVVDSGLEPLQDHTVGSLDLAVSSRVSYGGPIHTDVMLVAEVQELFAGELRAVVGDNDVGYPEPVDYVGEE